MQQTREMLNQFLVKIFNKIMFNEEAWINAKLGSKITIRNVHILEAINTAISENNSSMGNIANKLCITAGTLTVALKKLETQGYIKRKQNKEDKRVYNISLTSAAKKVLALHDQYHNNLIDTVTSNLSIKEEANLVDLLSKIKYYFTN